MGIHEGPSFMNPLIFKLVVTNLGGDTALNHIGKGNKNKNEVIERTTTNCFIRGRLY